MKYISVDIETDGPCPGLYSLISLGAVMIDDELDKDFYFECCPVGLGWDSNALAVSGFTREQVVRFVDPEIGLRAFDAWLTEVANGERLLFVSDNAGFDWQFVNFYFWKYLHKNPFGWSPMSLTSLYKGFARTTRARVGELRKTRHTHNALDDAKGNAEAFLALRNKGMRF